MGGAIVGVILMGLVACGSSATPRGANGIPAASLAPVAAVTAQIPELASHSGVVTFGAFTSTEGETTFSEPYYLVTFDADGALDFLLPTTAPGGFSDYPGCPFAGHAALGMLFILELPATSGSVPTASIIGRYRLVAGETTVLFWYSPVTTRITCVSDASGNMSGGKPEDWDVRLEAGWNTVLFHGREEINYLRSGVPSAPEWEAIIR